MRFATPWLLLLLLVPLLRLWLRWRSEHRRGGAVAWVSAGVLEGIPRTPRTRLATLPRWLEFAGGSLLVLALARPQLDAGKEQIRLRSRNIIVALDISSSMKATDFQPGNRLMVARATLRDFVARREGDLVGLVLFSGKALRGGRCCHPRVPRIDRSQGSCGTDLERTAACARDPPVQRDVAWDGPPLRGRRPGEVRRRHA